MALIDKDQVKAEIRRRLSLIYLLEGDFTDGSRDAYEGLLSWLDTHPEQPVEGLEEKIEKYFQGWFNDDEYGDAVTPDYTGVNVDKCKENARHFYELGCRHTAEMYDDIEYERQRAEEAGNEEVEKELHQYWLEQKQKGVIVDGSIDDYITVQEVARHFAEWGAEHGKK